MESWERDHIKKHLPELIRDTICYPTFLAKLSANNVLFGDDIDALNALTDQKEKTTLFYKVIQTRSKSFDLLKQALFETSQSGVHNILNGCISQWDAPQSSLANTYIKDLISSKETVSGSHAESNKREGDLMESITPKMLRVTEPTDEPLTSHKIEIIIDRALVENTARRRLLLENMKRRFNQLKTRMKMDSENKTESEDRHHVSQHQILTVPTLMTPGMRGMSDDMKSYFKLRSDFQFSRLCQRDFDIPKEQFEEDENGQTILHHLYADRLSAATFPFRSLRSELAANGCSRMFNIRDNHGRTPLMLAAANTEIDMTSLSKLKELGVDLTLTDKEGKSILSYIVDGNINLKLLPDLLAHVMIKHTVLEEAIKGGDEEAVKVLVMLGCDVNLQNSNSETPLHLAARSSDKTFSLKIIRFLIKNGANTIHATDNENYTFLHRLMDDGTALTPNEFHDLSELLVSNNFSHSLNTFGNFEKTIRIDRHDHKHNSITPFHMAVKNLEIEKGTLSLLKENGVDFNALNANKDSVLAYGLLGKRTTGFLSELIKLGANPKHINKHGRNLLHRAAVYGSYDDLKLFLNLGLDLNAEDKWNSTPLNHIVYFRSADALEKIRLLISHGADLRIKDSDGRTPLLNAILRYDLEDRDEVIKLLTQSEIKCR